VGQTAQLLFRPVLCEATGATKKAVAVTTMPACGASYLDTAANLAVNSSTGNPTNNIAPDPSFAAITSTSPQNDNKANEVLLPALGDPALRYVLGPSQLTGHSVHSAVAQQNTIGQWVVNYTLTKTGSPLWDKVAEKNFHALLAIELDGVVQSAPLIQPAQATFSSFDGQGEISGSFNEQSAKNLALAMQFGSLPVRLVPLTTQVVTATLGHGDLVAGLGAGLVGLALVLLYTILYYRALGLVILLGLAATGALLWAIISALGHTALAPSFDLAGVTGLIVSIGITVDSYIVYFERLKDEARAGRSIRSSVDRGFRSAWRTVLAADTVSLLAAILLYVIAVGDVRGFAFFLGISTLMDIGITWYFTRPLVILLGRRGSQSSSMLSMAAGLTSGGFQNE
jgi:preprotein translocase subunit SecD